MKQGDKRICQICGNEFEIKFNGWSRKYCYNCSPSISDKKEKDNFAKNLNIKRHSIKQKLVEEAGGKCQRCGYNKCLRALEFHHLDPNEKDFGISTQLNRDLDDLRKEISKCVLLCSNCHAEIHEEIELQQNNGDK